MIKLCSYWRFISHTFKTCTCLQGDWPLNRFFLQLKEADYAFDLQLYGQNVSVVEQNIHALCKIFLQFIFLLLLVMMMMIWGGGAGSTKHHHHTAHVHVLNSYFFCYIIINKHKQAERELTDTVC